MFGQSSDAKIPIIKTTTMTSMRVKPRKVTPRFLDKTLMNPSRSKGFVSKQLVTNPTTVDDKIVILSDHGVKIGIYDFGNYT